PHAGVERRQLEAGAAREDDRAMDGVLQLADVPGPRMAHEACHDLRHEVAYEKRDVLGPLAERGKVYRNDVQAVVEVGSEFSILDQLLERTVGRGDDPDITSD